jgi:hypothetical protein
LRITQQLPYASGMAKGPRPWTVTRHDAIVQLDENLWTVDGAVPGIPGGHFPRKMMIVKRADGTLLLHNAMPLDEAGMRALVAIGKPSILVAPSPFHCMDAHAVKARLGVKVLCPAASAREIGARVEVDGDYGALAGEPDIEVVTLDGVRSGEAVFLVRGKGGAINMVMCDVMLNIPHLSGFWGWLWKVMGFTGGPRCGPVWLKRAVADRQALQRHLVKLADTPKLARLVPSHGPAVDRDPGGTLRAVAARL